MTLVNASGKGIVARDPTGIPFADPAALAVVMALLGRRDGAVESTVRGSSMGDTLADGTRIRIRGRQGVPEVGQVVVAVGGATLIAHRLVGIGRSARARGFLLTRGDGSLLCDWPIPVSDVVAVATEYRTSAEWQPLPLPRRRPWWARVRAAAHRALMQGAMELDPRVAGLVARCSFRLADVMARARRAIAMKT